MVWATLWAISLKAHLVALVARRINVRCSRAFLETGEWLLLSTLE
jgi:hypothetical protein